MPSKCANEAGQRPETTGVGDFADANTGIQQELARLFHPTAGSVFRESHAGLFLEKFAEIAGAQFQSARDIA